MIPLSVCSRDAAGCPSPCTPGRVPVRRSISPARAASRSGSFAPPITAAFESVAKRPTVFQSSGLSSALKCGLNPIRNSFMNG